MKECPYHLFEIGPARAPPKVFPFPEHRSLDKVDHYLLSPAEKRRAFDRQRYERDRKVDRAA